ncbi:hypothetical protein BDZ89DRAFT_1249558 [Hymenopellis radicata]|nr:hypothetical protein BDZ89DRAFT_1249558 [Hymenopellis radicata]
MAKVRRSGPTGAARRTPEEAARTRQRRQEEREQEERALVEKSSACKTEYRARNREACNLRSAEAMRRRRAQIKALPSDEQEPYQEQRRQHDANYRLSHANERRAASERRRHAHNPNRVTRTGHLQVPEAYSASDKCSVQQNNAAKAWRRGGGGNEDAEMDLITISLEWTLVFDHYHQHTEAIHLRKSLLPLHRLVLIPRLVTTPHSSRATVLESEIYRLPTPLHSSAVSDDDSEGNVRYDAIARQGQRPDKFIQSQFKDLVPLHHRNDLDESDRAMDRPSEEDVQSTTEKTHIAKLKLHRPNTYPTVKANRPSSQQGFHHSSR